MWNDEFDYTGAPNSSKWHHQTYPPGGSSWFNGEEQHYTARIENSYVSNGSLKIEAIKEPYRDPTSGSTKQYTAARLNSKYAFKYGRMEVKAKLPAAQGTWPAIWTLGKNISENGAYWQTQGYGDTAWPACGEIDIMEHWGREQNLVKSATHTPYKGAWTVVCHDLGNALELLTRNASYTLSFSWIPFFDFGNNILYEHSFTAASGA